MQTTGEVPSIQRVALAPLPLRYERQVINALKPAGVAVVPQGEATHELVVYLQTRVDGDSESAPIATEGWYSIDGDNLRGGAAWFAVGIWTLFGLLDSPGSANRSTPADTDQHLLVQLVSPRSHRVVWSCSITPRKRALALDGADRNKESLGQALAQFQLAIRR